jgi:hypothetical protein
MTSILWPGSCYGRSRLRSCKPTRSRPRFGRVPSSRPQARARRLPIRRYGSSSRRRPIREMEGFPTRCWTNPSAAQEGEECRGSCRPEGWPDEGTVREAGFARGVRDRCTLRRSRPSLYNQQLLSHQLHLNFSISARRTDLAIRDATLEDLDDLDRLLPVRFERDLQEERTINFQFRNYALVDRSKGRTLCVVI